MSLVVKLIVEHFRHTSEPYRRLFSETSWVTLSVGAYAVLSIGMLGLDKKNLYGTRAGEVLGAAWGQLGCLGCLLYILVPAAFWTSIGKVPGLSDELWNWCCGLVALGFTVTNFIAVRNRLEYYWAMERPLSRRSKLETPRRKSQTEKPQIAGIVVSPSAAGTTTAAEDRAASTRPSTRGAFLDWLLAHPMARLIGFVSALLGIVGFLLHLFFKW